MSQQYETITSVQPINPNRDPLIVYLCRGCGALVASMSLHDAFHASLESGTVQRPIGGPRLGSI